MVNRDIIFYKLILPVTGPATEIEKDYFNMNDENRYVDIEDISISIRSHFAFNTFSYSVRAKRFNLNTGEAMVGFPSRIKEYIMGIVPLSEYSGGFIHTELEGDIIKATWEGNLNQDEEVDFQIRGAHLPILGKFNRAIFWAVVWIFIIFVFVSPFITFILEYMMGSIS
jgi:hypothetical protein